ncbi:MAG TPA: hypothetical protein VEP90_27830 [Methylomirabilota bacterium]|nr:hypothetical protein [Methylomirabilota bacterium]
MRRTTKANRSPQATRRSAAKNEYGGSFFAADLLVATSRLQTASKEAVYPHFLGAFQAVLG